MTTGMPHHCTVLVTAKFIAPQTLVSREMPYDSIKAWSGEQAP
jgi:hypothetical protein